MKKSDTISLKDYRKAVNTLKKAKVKPVGGFYRITKETLKRGKQFSKYLNKVILVRQNG